MKKSMKLAVAGLAAVAVVGGSFAYWNVTTSIDNEFSTNAFGGETTEEFNPVAGNNWQPGGKVDKVVGVANTGGYPIMARIKFEEKWERDGQQAPIFELTSKDDNFFPATADADIVDGGSRVYKEMSYEGWNAVDTEGWFVSTDAIQPGASLGLLKSVTLLPGAVDEDYEEKTLIAIGDDGEYKEGSMAQVPADNGGVKLEITYADGTRAEVTDPATVVKQKVEKVVKDEKGYANAKYTLTITTQLAQINPETNMPMWPENN